MAIAARSPAAPPPTSSTSCAAAISSLTPELLVGQDPAVMVGDHPVDAAVVELLLADPTSAREPQVLCDETLLVLGHERLTVPARPTWREPCLERADRCRQGVLPRVEARLGPCGPDCSFVAAMGRGRARRHGTTDVASVLATGLAPRTVVAPQLDEPAGDAGVGQRLLGARWQVCGQLDEREVRPDGDVPEVPPVQPALVGQGAHDLSGLYPVPLADGDPVRRQGRAVGSA